MLLLVFSRPQIGQMYHLVIYQPQALGTVKDVAYNYSYDPLNRILSASYLNNTAGTWANASGAFSESGYAYDQNGNITALTRKGATGTNMDLLAYNYGTVGNVAYGNQLLRVGDTGDKTTGFVDGANTGNDYTYDANGNMITDQNKGITGAIAYNFLNLPELVTRGTSNTLRYIYDATGRKLAQVATYNSAQKQTEYMGEYQYENDVLLQLNHEEGRIVVSSTESQYTNSGDNTANITSTNAALALVTQNGTQTYISATSSGTVARTGMTFTTLNVTAGDRYMVRVKGYRDKGTSATSNPVFLSIRANGVDQGWPGATLANSVATEAWTEQSVVVPTGATTLAIGMGWNTTVTTGELFFVNDVEVIKIAATAPEYQYNLKDHLGNVRVTFTSKDETENSIATSELSNIAAEQAKFLNREKVRAINSVLFDHTYDGQPTPPTGTYAQRLSGKDGEKIGLARSISVMPGDKINIEVYAKYYDPTASNEATFANLMSAIINNIGVPAGTFVDGSGYGQSTNLPFTPGWAAKDGTGAPPMAYLNWMVFDRNYSQDLGRSGYMRITTNAKETGTNATHDKLFSPEITITQPGYVYIWLSNENPTPVEVYFDDFKVSQTKSPVIASNDYYPFGLSFNSYQRENSLANDYKYNGKEEQNELGIGWLDYGARMYQPDVSRFFTQDRFAEKYDGLSPYQYAALNPIKYIDVNGDSTFLIVYGSGFLSPTTQGRPYDVGDGFKKNAQARANELKKNLKKGDGVVVVYAATEEEYVNALNQQYSTGVIKQLDVYSHGTNNSINLGGPENGAPTEQSSGDADYRLVSAMMSVSNPDGNDETQRINSGNFATNAVVNLWGCNLGGQDKNDIATGNNHAQHFANQLGGSVTVNAFNGGGGAEFKQSGGKNVYDGTMIRSADRGSQRVIQTAYKPR